MTIVPFTEEWVPEVFDLIEADRDHLNQFNEGTADKYPTIEKLYESIPAADPLRERYVIIGAGSCAVGSINATSREPFRSLYSVGYWIGGEHTGHGYAKAALFVLEGLLRTRSASHLFASTHPNNIASQRVLLGAGFTQFNLKGFDRSFGKRIG